MSSPAETEPNPPRLGRKILVCAGVVAGLVAGCYQPKVVSGGLKCSIATHECPDGFTCSGGSCVSNGAGTGGRSGGGQSGGGSGGSSGSGGAGGSGTCEAPIAPLCAPPTMASSGCDPVCQTGCGCGLRCNVTATGNACLSPAGSKAAGQLCRLDADDCSPGFACLRETCGSDLGRCYRFCRDQSMCDAPSACARAVTLPNGTPSGQRVCDLGDQNCDPYAANACPDPALHCYVLGGTGTTCDCPSVPERQEGESCSGYNDCAPGLACVTIAAVTQCRRLCHTTADCAGCLALGPAVSYCAP